MPTSSLTEYLDRHNIKYVRISHSPAFTAQGVAALAHISGKDLAKTVVIKMDGKLVVAVLPASLQVDLEQFKKATKAMAAMLASEDDFRDRFPECEIGAMPPFGNLYGFEVFADDSLAKDKEIASNACSHRELIRLAWEDFAKLAKPAVIRFAAGRSAEAA
ncbi:MAG: YbaK/EbsC family protein [Acidobacteria bacterium]|nr:YbaK/EbsC family protein [Acidobacteriota bacterium]